MNAKLKWFTRPLRKERSWAGPIGGLVYSCRVAIPLPSHLTIRYRAFYQAETSGYASQLTMSAIQVVPGGLAPHWKQEER